MPRAVPIVLPTSRGSFLFYPVRRARVHATGATIVPSVASEGSSTHVALRQSIVPPEVVLHSRRAVVTIRSTHRCNDCYRARNRRYPPVAWTRKPLASLKPFVNRTYHVMRLFVCFLYICFSCYIYMLNVFHMLFDSLEDISVSRESASSVRPVDTAIAPDCQMHLVPAFVREGIFAPKEVRVCVSSPVPPDASVPCSDSETAPVRASARQDSTARPRRPPPLNFPVRPSPSNDSTRRRSTSVTRFAAR